VFDDQTLGKMFKLELKWQEDVETFKMNMIRCKDGETGGWRKLHDEVLRSLYSSANISMIKSLNLGRAV
jgi:hypothetical protein